VPLARRLFVIPDFVLHCLARRNDEDGGVYLARMRESVDDHQMLPILRLADGGLSFFGLAMRLIVHRQGNNRGQTTVLQDLTTQPQTRSGSGSPRTNLKEWR
jgi:hypothetical protein